MADSVSWVALPRRDLSSSSRFTYGAVRAILNLQVRKSAFVAITKEKRGILRPHPPERDPDPQ